MHEVKVPTLEATAATILRLPVQRHHLVAALAFAGPVLLTLVAIKVYKVVFALWPVTNTFDWDRPTLLRALVDAATSSTAVLMLATGACLAVLLLLARRRVWTALATAGAAFALLMIAAHIRLRHTGGSPLSVEFALNTAAQAARETREWLALVRADLVFAGVYGFVLLAVMTVLARASHRWAFAAFAIVNLVLLAAAGLELAHYAKTGVAVSGDLLVYFVQNLRGLAPMIAAEADGAVVVMVVTPLLLLFATPVILRLRGQQSAARLEPVYVGRWLWPGLLLLAVVPSQLEQHLYRLAGNTFVTTATGLSARVYRSFVSSAVALEGTGYDVIGLRFETGATPARRLNVVVIMLESVRARSTGIHNPRLRNTPFLDRLSKRALVAEDMYAVVPRTSTAWVSVLQGIYPTTNTTLMWWAQQKRATAYPSLPRLLAPHGYRSAFFVPTHLNYENEWRLLANMAFDRVVSEKDYDAKGYERPNYFGLEDRVMIPPVMSWVDAQRAAGNPFFLTVMTNVGHHRYDLPSTWRKQRYVDDEDENNYLNCIRYIDEFLAQTFDEFEQRGLLDSTVFLILGDHGDSFGEHGVRQRALTLFEDEVHVPMLVFAPSLYPAGGRIVGARQQVDILPTIADLLGYRITHGAPPGVSLLESVSPDRPVFFNTVLDDVGMAMRRGPRKYLYFFNRTPMQVYDLATDRDERRDISRTIASDELAEAEQDMLDWSVKSKITLLPKPR